MQHLLDSSDLDSLNGSVIPTQDRLPVVSVPVLSRATVEHSVRASRTLLSLNNIPLHKKGAGPAFTCVQYWASLLERMF